MLKAIPINRYDFTISGLFAKNYIWLKKNNEAIPYLNNVLEQLDEQTLDEKLKWYVRAGNLYSRLDDNIHYIEFVEKEILIREEIIEESISNDVWTGIETEKAINLADSYLKLSVAYWNGNKDYNQSLYYAIEYLDTLSFIPESENYKSQKSIESNRKGLYGVFSPQNLLTNFEPIALEIEKEINPNLFAKIQELFDLYSRVNDLVFYKTSKYYDAAMKHASSIYEEIYPYVQNKKETEPENMGEIFHFISKGVDNQVFFLFKDILLHKSEGVLKSLTQHIATKCAVNSFLNNLLISDGLSIDSLEDKVLLKLLNFHLWDYNKLMIWFNLFVSLHIQKKSAEAEKALKEFENILGLLNEQPIEEQALWVERGFDLYFYLRDAKQTLYYAIKYLNVLLLIPNLDNIKLQEKLETYKKRLYSVFSPEVLFVNFKSIAAQLEKEVNPNLFAKTQELFDLYSRVNDLVFYKTSKYYDAAMKHASSIYEEIYPYVQNKKETEPGKDGEMLHFISKGMDYEVYFSFDAVLLHKAESVLKTLVSPIFIMSTVNSFLNNLLSAENLLSDENKDIALSILLDCHLLNRDK